MHPAETYILNQPEPYHSILLHLQIIIENSVQRAELKYKWKVPCYYINNKPFCYLNASHKGGFVDLGFWHSAYLDQFDAYMVNTNRKVVRSLRYTTLQDIDNDLLVAVLTEAEKHNGKPLYK